MYTIIISQILVLSLTIYSRIKNVEKSNLKIKACNKKYVEDLIS